MGTKAPWLVLVLIRDFSRRLWLLRRNDFHVQHIGKDGRQDGGAGGTWFPPCLAKTLAIAMTTIYRESQRFPSLISLFEGILHSCNNTRLSY
jgi:hypothetical protein